MLDINAPLDIGAIDKARALMVLMPKLDPGDLLHRAYGHWTAGGYCDKDAQYNFSTGLDESGEWQCWQTHDPRDNARQISEGMPYAAHTYHRNSFALGFAADGMGPDAPVQEHEAELFLAMIAAGLSKYGIDVLGRINGEPIFMTHAEAAIADGYWPDRIDFAAWPPFPADKQWTQDEAHATGDAMRLRIHRYKLQMV